MPRELSQTPRAIRRRENAAAKARGEVVKRGRPVGSKTKAAPDAPSAKLAPAHDAPARGATPSTAHALPAAPDSSVAVRGAIRRLRALVAIGYSPGEIAQVVGATPDAVWMLALTPPDTLPQVAIDGIAKAYRALASKPRPHGDHAQHSSIVDATRLLAHQNGWASPVAWEDIDHDPDPLVPRRRSETASPRPGETPPPQGQAGTTAASRLAAQRAHVAAVQRVAHERVTVAEGEAIRLGRLLEDARRSVVSKDAVIADMQERVDEAQIRASEAEARARGTLMLPEELEELRQLRAEVAVRRLVGEEVTCALGGVMVAGVLRGVDEEGRTALVAIAGEEPRRFPLDAWALERP